jgi:hypothetical protein
LKTTLTLVVCLLVAVATASAASASAGCVPYPFGSPFSSGATGNATETCGNFNSVTGLPVAANPYVTLLSVTLSDHVDYAFGGASGTNTIAGSFFAPAAQAFSPNPGVATNTGTINSTTSTDALQTSLAALSNFLASFTVSINMSVTAGTVSTDSAGALLTYNYNYNPPTGTPEPTTMCLIGLGLLGLGVPRLAKKLR